MDTREKKEALELALTNEQKERDFYLKHAERTRDPVGRKMFASIAADEEEHYQRLLDLHGRMDERMRWPDGFSTDISSSKIASMIDRIIAKAGAETKHDDNDIEALRIAIAFELKGEALYSRLAESAPNEHEKHFFALLASMEREHRLSLDSTLEYFENPDGWMRRTERGGLDGA